MTGSDLSSYCSGVEQALQHLRDGDTEEALGVVSELLDRHPDQPWLLLLSGRLLQMVNGPVEDIQLAGRQLSIADKLSDGCCRMCVEIGHYNRAIRGEHTSAIQNFQRALRRASLEMIDAFCGLIRCALDRGDVASAKDLFAELKIRFAYERDQTHELLASVDLLAYEQIFGFKLDCPEIDNEISD